MEESYINEMINYLENDIRDEIENCLKCEKIFYTNYYDRKEYCDKCIPKCQLCNDELIYEEEICEDCVLNNNDLIKGLLCDENINSF